MIGLCLVIVQGYHTLLTEITISIKYRIFFPDFVESDLIPFPTREFPVDLLKPGIVEKILGVMWIERH
jgi:hypothetical protein